MSQDHMPGPRQPHDHAQTGDHAHGHDGGRRHLHGHDHAAGRPHRHAPPTRGGTPEVRARRERAVGLAAAVTGAFMLAEVVGGWVSGSLALLADAGHMLTDFASLVLAWLAFRLARRPADSRRTYGFDRVSVLAAFVNGLSLVAIGVWIIFEAWQRLRAPAEVLGGLMLAIAVAGLLVNIVAYRILAGAGDESLNVRAAAMHVMGDLLGSVAAIIASGVILATGWMPIDPLLSVLVALLILRSAWSVIRESAHILLEGAPAHLDIRAVADDLAREVEGVHGASHLHAWMISEERPMVTLEVMVEQAVDRDAVVVAVKQRLRETWGVDHVTVEITAARGAH